MSRLLGLSFFWLCILWGGGGVRPVEDTENGFATLGISSLQHEHIKRGATKVYEWTIRKN